jgi:hypothetical protein
MERKPNKPRAMAKKYQGAKARAESPINFSKVKE